MAHSICYCCYVRGKHEAVHYTLHTVILGTAGNLVSIDSSAKFTTVSIELQACLFFSPKWIYEAPISYNCIVRCKLSNRIYNLSIFRRIAVGFIYRHSPYVISTAPTSPVRLWYLWIVCYNYQFSLHLWLKGSNCLKRYSQSLFWHRLPGIYSKTPYCK